MTIFESYNNTKKKLEEAGIEDYVFEAKIIIKHITGLSSAQILTEYNKELTEYQQNNLTAIIKQREIRYPLQYIIGKWDFFGNEFYVGPGVLIPRSDTEVLVEKCNDYLKDIEEATVLDLCTGSGCIGISIAKKYPGSKVFMVEKYQEAFDYAQKNINLNNVKNTSLILEDIENNSQIGMKFDIIVSNPPYIPCNERDIMSPETQYEPESSLMAEDYGLYFYKKIISIYKNSLKPNGMIAFEVGINQSLKVKKLLEKEDFLNPQSIEDLNGIERVVFAIK